MYIASEIVSEDGRKPVNDQHLMTMNTIWLFYNPEVFNRQYFCSIARATIVNRQMKASYAFREV